MAVFDKMAVFKDMLKADETIFKNELALDYSYIPKVIPYREKEQRHIALCIKPLLAERNGRNLIITGRPGVGKTVACRHLFQELEEETEEVVPIYVNCWTKNTTYKIMLEICSILGYKWVQNKKTEELFEEIKKIINKRSAVFAFDEIDKAEDYDFLYWIIEGIYKKSVLLITNYKEWILKLDERIKSRLVAESIEFPAYNYAETEGILKQRVEYAFHPGVVEQQAFILVAKKSFEKQDIRSGLYLLREAGNCAEDDSSRKITIRHAEKAIEKITNFAVKNEDDLEDETKYILRLVKENSGKKIGDIFRIYQAKGGVATYKTFQRKVKKLEENKFISVLTTIGGSEGSTSILNFEKEKKITDF